MCSILKFKTESFNYWHVSGSFFVLCLLLLLRFLFLEGSFLEGTGGQSILNTFSFNEFIKHFLWAIGLIFGWNFGEFHLNGISLSSVPIVLNVIPFIFVLLFLYSLFILFVRFKTNSLIINYRIYVMLIALIILSVLSASITFRLELRWLFVPYCAFILFIALSLVECFSKKKFVYLCIYIICSILYSESYFRSKWHNNYLGGNYSDFSYLYEDLFKSTKYVKFDSLILIDNNLGEYVLFPKDQIRMFLDFYFDKKIDFHYFNHIEDIPSNLISNHCPIVISSTLPNFNLLENKQLNDLSIIFNKCN